MTTFAKNACVAFAKACISDGFINTILYEKRDDFDVVNFPFVVGDAPTSTSYGLFFSPQLI